MFWTHFVTGPSLLCPVGFHSDRDSAIAAARSRGGFAIAYQDDNERARILRQYAEPMRLLAASGQAISKGE